MAHGITRGDTMMSVQCVPWHGLAAALSERPRNLDDALDAAGLAWTVAKEPLCRADGRTVDGHHATVRQDTDTVLGVVSDDYVVVQNRDCFAFLAGLLGSELVFETAGSVWEGRQVFITAALPDDISVGGDEVRPYVVLSARHTDTGAMTTPVRAVCANTVRAALERARSVYRVRHIGDPTGRLHEARAVMAVFTGGDTVGNAPGSKWCAWDAIVQVHDHHGRTRTPEVTWTRAIEDPSGRKARALDLVLAA